MPSQQTDQLHDLYAKGKNCVQRKGKAVVRMQMMTKALKLRDNSNLAADDPTAAINNSLVSSDFSID